jgi:precorrin-6B methylase 1
VLKLVLNLKLEEKGLAARDSIFSLLSSQMFRCARARVCMSIVEFSSLKTEFLMFLIVFVTINQDSMLIAKEEIFGPVQSIFKFK